MEILGYCCFSIWDETLDFEDIKKNLGFEPQSVTHRGDYDESGKIHSEDVWVYEVTFKEEDDIDKEVYKFVSFLMNYKDYIHYLSIKNNVRLWCDIYADVQSNIFFLPKTIDMISKLGIGIEIETYLHEEETDDELLH